MIPNFTKPEYGRNKIIKEPTKIRIKDSKILMYKVLEKNLLAVLKSLDNSLVTIAFKPKSAIIKKSAGKVCIKLKAP